jgi:predicted DCC family thiol-disulfide oxidoreductase YuxK
MTPDAPQRWPDDDVFLYDGVCVFCSRWIRYPVFGKYEECFVPEPR